MPPSHDGTTEIDDPALAGGDWLFKKDGQVYGPVEGRRLAALLYRGDVTGATLVSSGDGLWQPLDRFGLFLVHVRKAEAAQRVEQEVTGRRKLQARQTRTRHLGLAAAALVVLLGAGGAAFVLGRSRVERSPLLDDFGAGISIVAPARVAVARRAGVDEVEVALDSGGPARRPAGAAAARAAGSEPSRGAGRPSGAVEGGDLVETQFDADRIQAVVAAQQRTLARCLREQAVRAPDFAGEVPLEFTVGNEGRVVRVTVTDPRLRQGPLRDCFEQVLATWTFDRFPGQRPTVSLVFRVGP